MSSGISTLYQNERNPESEFYQEWYKNHGYQITQLPENLYFEGGGELQHWRNKILIGTGFRTDQKASEAVGKIFNKEVIRLDLIDERFYHLDTCLMVLNDDVVFYYPEALSTQAVSSLRSIIPTLVEIDKEEVTNFAANSVVFGSTVFIQKGNKEMARQIEQFGYKVIDIDISEFMKAGGGAHCLTGDLGEL